MTLVIVWRGWLLKLIHSPLQMGLKDEIKLSQAFPSFKLTTLAQHYMLFGLPRCRVRAQHERSEDDPALTALDTRHWTLHCTLGPQV